MNFRKLITGTIPLTNNSRRYIWALAWRRATGLEPIPPGHKVMGCRVCHKPIWVKKDLEISPLDITCSADCYMQLEKLRLDKHWS